MIYRAIAKVTYYPKVISYKRRKHIKNILLTNKDIFFILSSFIISIFVICIGYNI